MYKIERYWLKKDQNLSIFKQNIKQTKSPKILNG